MALVTYEDLKTTIADYLARSDLTSVIPDFIRLAETRLTRDLRIRQMLFVAQATTTGGDSTVGIPGDYLEMRDIHVVGNPNGGLKYNTPNIFFKRTTATESGKPVRYTVLSAEMQLAPIPDGAYQLQMLYYAKPPLLSATVPTNVWTLNCIDALLYGALAEAEPYMMNDARIQVWASLYDRSISSISVADQGGEYSGQPISMVFN